ncbi:hypothetical protein HGA34_01030 [Candidatus Falkowbacteria bacterium]|nr:hypothetical protein [Candidatus Falkowbacteria bacterium]
MTIEQPETQPNNFVEFAQTLSAADKARLEYILNFIGETEKSLEMADDQLAVIEALKEVFQAESDQKASKVAKDVLEELL